MPYRGWNIRAYAYFAGYTAQYTSPTGRTHQTPACFDSDLQAIAYAQAMVDHLVRCELLLLEGRHAPTLAA